MQWLIVSKAANKSSNTSTEPCLLSRFDGISLEIFVSTQLTFYACKQIEMNVIECLLLGNLLVAWL